MAFTLFWKIYIIVYLVITFMFFVTITEKPDKPIFKKISKISDLPFYWILSVILIIAQPIMSLILFINVAAAPISNYVTVTETKKVYEIICDDCDYCREEYDEYYPDEDEDEDDWMYEDVWGY